MMKEIILTYNFRTVLFIIVMSFGAFVPNNTYANDKLWAKLSKGGYVVLVRHSLVKAGRDNGDSLLRDPSCEKERNLSSDGSFKAKKMGKIFRNKNIPISDVWHSPFCRASDTARLAFENVKPVEYLSLLEIAGPKEAIKKTNQLSQAIGSYKGKGNLILVTHESNINAVSFETVRHLDLLVLKPMGNDTFDELGIIQRSE